MIDPFDLLVVSEASYARLDHLSKVVKGCGGNYIHGLLVTGEPL